jgi:hypothetical protein
MAIARNSSVGHSRKMKTEPIRKPATDSAIAMLCTVSFALGNESNL